MSSIFLDRGPLKMNNSSHRGSNSRCPTVVPIENWNLPSAAAWIAATFRTVKYGKGLFASALNRQKRPRHGIYTLQLPRVIPVGCLRRTRLKKRRRGNRHTDPCRSEMKNAKEASSANDKEKKGESEKDRLEIVRGTMFPRGVRQPRKEPNSRSKGGGREAGNVEVSLATAISPAGVSRAVWWGLARRGWRKSIRAGWWFAS